MKCLSNESDKLHENLCKQLREIILVSIKRDVYTSSEFVTSLTCCSMYAISVSPLVRASRTSTNRHPTASQLLMGDALLGGVEGLSFGESFHGFCGRDVVVSGKIATRREFAARASTAGSQRRLSCEPRRCYVFGDHPLQCGGWCVN